MSIYISSYTGVINSSVSAFVSFIQVNLNIIPGLGSILAQEILVTLQFQTILYYLSLLINDFSNNLMTASYISLGILTFCFFLSQIYLYSDF